MTPAALLLVLGAAVLHTVWNTLAKRARHPLAFLWSSISLATIVLLLPGVWIMREQPPTREGAPFVIGTIVVHAVYFYALGRSYASGQFSLVYPVARGLGVALVPVLALLLLAERLSSLGILGIALVVAGIVAIHLPGAVRLTARPPVRRVSAGTGWAVLTGLTIATYSTLDKAGVARVHPLAYISLMGVGMSVLLLPSVLRQPETLRREWTLNWRSIAVAATLNLTSYLLVLFAFRLAKAGYVVAAREVSIVLSVVVGGVWLKEGHLGPRLLGAIVVLLGVACVAMAR
jgi:drug/metabolite transporter (DMT)-like permease